MKRMRRVLVVGMVLMMFGMLSCSTVDGRRDVVSPIGDVVWRQDDVGHGVDELFVIVDEDSMLFVVEVNSRGNIERISKVGMRVIESEVVIGIDED